MHGTGGGRVERGRGSLSRQETKEDEEEEENKLEGIDAETMN